MRTPVSVKVLQSTTVHPNASNEGTWLWMYVQHGFTGAVGRVEIPDRERQEMYWRMRWANPGSKWILVFDEEISYENIPSFAHDWVKPKSDDVEAMLVEAVMRAREVTG